MQEFIFGSLSTEELRVNHLKKLRAGVTHRMRLDFYTPRPGQTFTITELEPTQIKLRPGLCVLLGCYAHS